MIEIREEEPCSQAAVRHLNEVAFRMDPRRLLWTTRHSIERTATGKQVSVAHGKR